LENGDRYHSSFALITSINTVSYKPKHKHFGGISRIRILKKLFLRLFTIDQTFLVIIYLAFIDSDELFY